MLTALLLCPAWTGFAAPAGNVPDAGKLLPDRQNVERKIPSYQKPDVEVGETIRPPLIADTGTVRVERIQITGQEFVPQSALDPLIAQYLHKELSFTDLNNAAAAVTKYFREQGYLLAEAYLPAQEIENGKVEIAILIGQYGDIVLKNTSTVNEHIIKKQLAALQSGNYINNRDLERAVLLAGDLAGVVAKITLTPGKKNGTADAIIETKNREKTSQGSISYNNWGNRFVGNDQGILAYNLENLAHSGDNLMVSLATAGSSLDVGSAGYRIPLSEGLALNLSYAKVHYSLGKEYADLNAHGTAYTRHADIAWNLQRSRNGNLNLQMGYDHKRLQDLRDTTNSLTEKRSHMVSLGLTGDSLDTLWGGGANSYSVMWYNGSLNAKSNHEAPPVGSWQKTAYNLLRQQHLAERLSLQVTFSGQLATANLDSSEQFSLGGPNGVRAYPANEAFGDEGWLLSSELHWTLPVKSDKGILQCFAFYDTGAVDQQKNPVVIAGNRKELAGKGLGVSWTVPGDYLIKLHYAWKAGSQAAISEPDKNGRLWLQSVKYF